MAAKKTAAKPAATKPNNQTFKVEPSKDTASQTLAKMATTSVLSALTLQSYSGAGDELEVSDLVTEMKRAGNEVVAGDLSRVEQMLTNQVLILDAIFNNMARRSFRQESYKGIEVLMRLALKAQAQARSTTEALALLKNPMPYIKQANIAHGHQQINNTGIHTPVHSGIRSHAGNSENEPNKLLEADHGERLDIGAQAAAGRAGQAVAALG